MSLFNYLPIIFIAAFILTGCQLDVFKNSHSIRLEKHGTELLQLKQSSSYPTGKVCWSPDSRILTFADSYENAIIQSTFTTDGKEITSRKIHINKDGPNQLNRLSLLAVHDSVAIVTDGIHLLLQDLFRKEKQGFFSLYPERPNSLYKRKDDRTLSSGNQWGATTLHPSKRVVLLLKKSLKSIRDEQSIELLEYNLLGSEVYTRKVNLPARLVQSIYMCNPNLLSPQITWTDTTMWINFQLYPDVFYIDREGKVIQYVPEGNHQLNQSIPSGQIQQATPQAFWPASYSIFGSIGYDPTQKLYVQWVAGPIDPPLSIRQRYLRIMNNKFIVLGEVNVTDKNKYGSTVFLMKEGIFIEAMDRESEQTIEGYRVIIN